MAEFSTAHAPVAVWEGGYGNHPADRGGETLCGIARGCHPDLALWKLVDAEKDHPSFRQGSAAFTRHLRQIPGLLEQVTARAVPLARVGLGRHAARPGERNL